MSEKGKKASIAQSSETLPHPVVLQDEALIDEMENWHNRCDTDDLARWYDISGPNDALAHGLFPFDDDNEDVPGPMQIIAEAFHYK